MTLGAKTPQQTDPHAYGLGLPAKFRVCAGPCHKTRSQMQFVGASTWCKQCVLRLPATERSTHG